MIELSLYLSDPKNIPVVMEYTDLALDEIEGEVGRFPNDHWRWPGQLKGEFVRYFNGRMVLRHHFKKTKLWEAT